MICRTPEEAFRAGYDAPCHHGADDPTKCPKCRLTATEIAALVALLGPSVDTPAAADTAA